MEIKTLESEIKEFFNGLIAFARFIFGILLILIAMAFSIFIIREIFFIILRLKYRLFQ